LLCCRKITIVGDVSFGENCSVWFNAVIRGDVNFITIGNKVNIQDGAVIHCTYKKHPTIIGNNVLLATTRSYTDVQFMIIIGMGAIVMDNCVIESNDCSWELLLKNTVVASGTIWAGVPAKKKH
jgi:carbonic anhydrase/acetyltransferase-like protein (isoleucine patch superfamily)